MNFKLLNSQRRYLIWRNEFNRFERKQIFSLALRTITGYTIFFVVLFNQQRISHSLFMTQGSINAAVSLRVLISLVLVIAYLIIHYMVKFHLYGSFGQKWRKFLCFLPPLFLLWIMFSSSTDFGLSEQIIFLCGTLVLILGFSYEKVLALQLILHIVSNPQRYRIIANIFFISVTVGSVIGSSINKFGAWAYHYHALSYKVGLILPLLLLCLLSSVIEVSVIREKIIVSHFKIVKFYAAVKRSRKEIMARIGVNALVGVFLVKWYYSVPFDLKLIDKWSDHAIAEVILYANLVAITINLLLNRLLMRYRLNKKLFLYFLLLQVLCLSLVSLNFYYHQWLFISIILIAVFYELLHSLTNRMIHLNFYSLQINVFLLIIGSGVGIVVVSFVSSLLTLILVEYSILPLSLLSLLVLAFFIIICAYSVYKVTDEVERKP